MNKVWSDHGLAVAFIQLTSQTNISNTPPHMYGEKYASIMGTVLDFNCPRAVDLIELSSRQEYFTTDNKWLILEDNEKHRPSILLQKLSVSYLYVNAEIAYFNASLLDRKSK